MTAARYVAILLRWRRVVIVGILLAVLPLAVLTARRVNDQDNTLGIWFAPGDPSYQRYQRVSAEFEGDRAVIVAFAAPDVFQPTVVDLVRTITRGMERIDGLARVSSLASAARYRSAGDAVIVDPLVPDAPHDAAQLAAARTQALANELLVGNLFSADGTTAAIVGWLRPGGSSAVEARIVRQLRTMLTALGRADVHFYLSGAPVVEATYSELATRDQNRLVPLTFAFVVLTLYVIFRQWTAAILAAVIQCLVFVAVVGTYLARGNQMNEVFGMIGPILIAACIGDSVYLITFYRTAHSEGRPARAALAWAIARAWRPCLFTSLTTGAGFLAFSASDVAPIQALGRYAAGGVLLEYVVNFSLVPIALYARRRRREPVTRSAPPGSGAVTQSIMRWLGRLSTGRPWAIVGMAAAVVVAALIGLARVEVASNTAEYVSPKAEVRRAWDFIEERLTGVSAFDVVLRGAPGMATDPHVLAAVDSLAQALGAEPELGKRTSAVDFLKEAKRLVTDDAGPTVPVTRAEAAQLALLAESVGADDLRRFVNADGSALRLTVRASFTLGSTRLGAILDRVEARARALVPPGITVELSGTPVLWRTIEEGVLRSQLRSFSLAFMIIMVALAVCLRSVRIAAVAVLPNLLPILATLGFMGYVGIPLEPATAMFASLAIGLAVDDTIQFASRMRVEMVSGYNQQVAIERTFEAIGGPIVFTSVVMIAGFGVLCCGEFVPGVHFGLLIGVALLVGLAGDLLVFPALLTLTARWKGAAREGPRSRGVWPAGVPAWRISSEPGRGIRGGPLANTSRTPASASPPSRAGW